MGPTKFEVLILGSGTSSQVPVISCLVAKPPKKGCQCCLSTMAPDGSGRKNMRRNTSAIVRFQANDDPLKSSCSTTRPSTILIDVGKSFCEAAREHFPKHGLDTIDAVFLTHPHADAINGLDDLRAWTLGGVIQATIPIYCNQSTFDEVAKIFPYMVTPGGGTGGGDVPAFQWHIIQSDVPFELLGVQVSPLKVYHGCYFNASGQTTRPYESLAFLFDQTVCYISDVSSIPESTLAALGCCPSSSAPSLRRSMSTFTEGSFSSDHLSVSSTGSTELGSLHSSASLVSEPDGPPPGLPLLIIDTMRLKPHISHFGIAGAVETAIKLRAHRTYILGFTHGVTHECWQTACELISDSSNTIPQSAPDSTTDFIEDFDLGNDPPRFSQQALALCQDHITDTPLWIRPAFDGLVITTDGLKTSDNSHTFQ